MNSLTSAKLVVKNISKSYGTSDKKIGVLSNIDLEVNSGEFVSIIGPNASGKSTLIKIIAGILPADSGSVSLSAEAVPHGHFHFSKSEYRQEKSVAPHGHFHFSKSEYRQEKLVAPHGHFHFSKSEYRQEKLVAYMPQDNALLPWRTVEENLLLPSDVREIPRGAMREKVRILLKEYGFLQYASFYPSALSGGTRQKIALLRMTLHEHSFLLLDEPFAPLDALSRLSAQQWLLGLVKKRQGSALMITHDIREAIFLSDVIYVLEKSGRILEKIRVSLPKPRTHEDLGTPAALDLAKKLFSLLLPAQI